MLFQGHWRPAIGTVIRSKWASSSFYVATYFRSLETTSRKREKPSPQARVQHGRHCTTPLVSKLRILDNDRLGRLSYTFEHFSGQTYLQTLYNCIFQPYSHTLGKFQITTLPIIVLYANLYSL